MVFNTAEQSCKKKGVVREVDADYTFSMSEEISEKELEKVPEIERKLCLYFMEHNKEQKIIEIRPGNGECISLHGAQDVENFIQAIRDYSRKVF